MLAFEVKNMRPEPATPDQTRGGQTSRRQTAETGHDSDEDGFDTWRALQKATDKKRADLIADIVGHPKGAPSVEELDYMNPPLSEDAVRRHLNTLKEVGVVDVLELESGKQVHGFPRQFYVLTGAARELFDQNGLFPEDAWQREYASVKKTARIQNVEDMPRPDA